PWPRLFPYTTLFRSRGDRLAGAGGVLEPEAAARAGGLRRFSDHVLVGLLAPVLCLLRLGRLLLVEIRALAVLGRLRALRALRFLDPESPPLDPSHPP